MNVTVSISDFRQNISDYLERARRGDIITIHDNKKKTDVAELAGKKTFDKKAYIAALRRAAGTFTAERHPEWATKAKVIKWLRESRLKDERKFDF